MQASLAADKKPQGSYAADLGYLTRMCCQHSASGLESIDEGAKAVGMLVILSV